MPAATAATTENAGGVIILTDNSFNEMIKKGVTLVDFWATWCRPCRIQAPILDEVSAEMKGKAVIGKLDVDQNPVISGKYFIQSIPTMLIFKDGKVVKTFVGVTSKEVIIAEINKALK
ncbi:MAG TPA: thioredoxin [Bacteroidales bacterium]|nr:thioredoxin [Bacteroidales bacterium]